MKDRTLVVARAFVSGVESYLYPIKPSIQHKKNGLHPDRWFLYG